ncbi:hypothetical protein [Emticicia agri]|uniref:DUF4911 domain-containing protein n=1 Tax=Emticicia agri TaxID=2492393 RepID=A0A4Q5LV61_9BACT|nr:hypothetical protein [Emticicia agri]RYU93578.1 hypothetical protein EWM59_21260 [Emticicia agri]
MKITRNSMRGDVLFLLEKYDLLHEEITPSTAREGLTITFTRKNDPRKFQRLIHYLNAENIDYYAYFCPIVKRIKVNIYVD